VRSDNDNVMRGILDVLASADEPLETKEIEERLKIFIKRESITRTKVFYRLNFLRGDGKVKGKFSGPGKGVWIWWRIDAFKNKK
jgi:hypothetical protein